jgi:hypothetical protein
MRFLLDLSRDTRELNLYVIFQRLVTFFAIIVFNYFLNIKKISRGSRAKISYINFMTLLSYFNMDFLIFVSEKSTKLRGDNNYAPNRWIS